MVFPENILNIVNGHTEFQHHESLDRTPKLQCFYPGFRIIVVIVLSLNALSFRILRP